jgi:uncharacterized membrane protein
MATSTLASPLTTATRTATVSGTAPTAATSRLATLDFVRGLAMVLMAIDHVRVYSGLPAGGPTSGIFFTRWVTHFVAPAFVFLAGTAAYLHGRKLGDRGRLSRFLLVRGLWLILLELTVIRVAWTFNVDFAHYLLAGVIWMIGWCMVLMSAIVFLPARAIGAIGIAIIALHNVTDLFAPSLRAAFGEQGPGGLFRILYFGGVVRLGASGPPLGVLFVIVPWIGVMMAGYALGAILDRPAEQRRTWCLRAGLALTAAFFLLRASNLYGDPRPWDTTRMPAVLAFLNTTKYPASLSFLLMTLGPMFIMLALAERWHGRVARAVSTFGQVPMFYYLLHIPVIHLAACLVSLVREGQVNPWLFGNHPLAPPPVPPGYTWSLPLLYLVFVLCVAVLYGPCRWYARLRATRRYWWLSYV